MGKGCYALCDSKPEAGIAEAEAWYGDTQSRPSVSQIVVAKQILVV